MALRAIGLALAIGLAATRLSAQDAGQTASQGSAPDASQSPTRLFLGNDDGAMIAGRSRPLDLGAWHVGPDFGYKGEPTRPRSYGVPKWQLGLRTSRELFSGIQVGVAATAMRGHQGTAYQSQELGTGRDLSVDSPLTGPDSYRTVWDAAFTVAVPLKSNRRVNLKAVGEIWNPFNHSTAGGSDPSALRSRALRIGLVMTY